MFLEINHTKSYQSLPLTLPFHSRQSVAWTLPANKSSLRNVLIENGYGNYNRVFSVVSPSDGGEVSTSKRILIISPG